MNKDFWKATGVRIIRTFLTTILGVWTAGTLITDVDWKTTLLSAFSASVYILILCVVNGLPEVKLTDTLYSLDNDPFDEDDDFEDGDE